jgi:hypothetical protein
VRTSLVVGIVACVVSAALLVCGGATWAAVELLDSGDGGGGKVDRPSLAKSVEVTDRKSLGRGHSDDRVPYPHRPPVGGPHHPAWQDCDSKVYDAPIADENAVHSLEHGAVWITYRPDLDRAQVDKLAARTKKVSYIMVSPYQDLDSPVSLQAWGYRLKVPDADDPRIDEFIERYRLKGVEPGAPCTGGRTTTGTTPGY